MENEKITCAFCVAEIDRDDAIEYRGGFACEACADDHLFWCDRCERYDIDTVEVRTGSGRFDVEHWCSECAERHASECARCGDLVSRYEVYDSRDGDICPYCFENYYYHCDECGENVCDDDWDSDNECCCECAPTSLVVGYHGADTSWPRFREGGEQIDSDEDLKSGEWFIGVEIEVDRDHRNNRAEYECTKALDDLLGDRAAYERDGSLNYGFEIVVRPHTLRAFVEEFPLAEVLEICRRHGYTSHDAGTCGLHVHISREMFGDTDTKQERAVGKLIAFYDRFFDSLVRASRRGRYEADRWASRIPVADIKEARKEARKGKPHSERYVAINTESLHTVEVRLMRGTLRESSFRACVDIAITTAANARRCGWDTATTDPAEMLRGISPATVAYLRERGAFLPHLDRVATGEAATVPAADGKEAR